jgi:hypothetical protein
MLAQGPDAPAEDTVLAAAESPAEAEPAAPKPEAGEGESGAPAAEPVDAGAAAKAVAETAPEDPPATNDEQITVLVIGDSLAATGFGVLLEKALDAHPKVTCHRKGKSATGLARPDFFDWMSESHKQIASRSPDVVIAIMGGNDGQDLTPKNKRVGKRVLWKSEGWDAGYRKRMDDLLDQLSQEDRRVVWLGLPKMGMRSLERKLELIRRIQREAVEALGDRGTLIETTPFLTDDAGELLSHGNVRGKRRELRADDGIHFTMAGSQYLADRVAPAVLNAIGVEAVQDEAADPAKAAADEPAAAPSAGPTPAQSGK